MTNDQVDITNEEIIQLLAQTDELKNTLAQEHDESNVEEYRKSLQKVVKLWLDFQNINSAITALRELISHNDNSEASSTSIGWFIFTLFKLIALDDFSRRQYAAAIPEFIEHYNNLRLPVPSPLHSAMMYMTNKLSGEHSEWFLQFFKRYGFESLQEIDFQEYFKEGKKFNPLAEQIFIKSAKTIEKENNKEYAAWLLESMKYLRNKMPNELWLMYHQGKLLVSLEQYTEARQCLRDVLMKQKNQYWAWAAFGSAMKIENPKLHLACLCKALSFPVEDHLLLGVREELIRVFINLNRFDEARTELDIAIATRKQNETPIPDELKQMINEPWYAGARAGLCNASIYLQNLDLADSVLQEDVSCYNGIVTAYFEEDKGIFVQFDADKITLYKPQRTGRDYSFPAIGTPVKIYVEESTVGNQKRYSAVKIELTNDMPSDSFCKQYLGELKLPPKTDTGTFGFVNEIFISAELVKKAAGKRRVSGLCVYEFNKKRNQFGWKALTLEPVKEEPNNGKTNGTHKQQQPAAAANSNGTGRAASSAPDATDQPNTAASVLDSIQRIDIDANENSR